MNSLASLNFQSSPITPTALFPFFWGIIISCILLGIRFAITTDDYYFFLPYNLILAIIPFVLACFIVHYNRHRVFSPLLLVAAGLVWLIFFPNAPYMVTDFIHLAPRVGIPIWFDAVLIVSFASTGLLAGWYSLYLMQWVVMQWFDTTTSWIFVVVSLTLASFGVYLGRFLRWNSWDLFMDPVRLANDLSIRFFTPSLHMRLWLVVGLLLGFFIVSYTSLVVFLQHERSIKRRH